MTLRDPPSDLGLRKTVSVRFKTPTTRLLQVVSQALFDGAYTGSIEAAFLEYAAVHGYLGEDSPTVGFPSSANTTTSQATGERLDDFITVVDVLSSRLESMASRGRIAIVDPELVLAFVRSAATFPGPIDPFELPPVEFVEQDAHSFTLQPQHIALIDEVGFDLFGRDRKRRAVLETALVWFAELHALSDVEQRPSFVQYPDMRLIASTRHFTRHVRALMAGLQALATPVGTFRLWSSVEHPLKASTSRLGNALFRAVKRDGVSSS